MCLFPITAYRWTSRVTGETGVQISSLRDTNYTLVKSKHKWCDIEPLTLPCGRCLECLTQYSSEWANRCMLESTLHKHCCMITLTFSVSDGSVHKSDLQLFMKRLRKAVKCPVRFFACGEYGKKGRRPHYHVIIFGWQPDDLVEFFYREDHWVYLSETVSKIWTSGDCWKSLERQPGYITVESLTRRSAKYCAKYLQKLQPLLPEQNPPFTLMSLRPAIGLLAFKPEWTLTDKMYIDGKSYPVPRYFRRKFGDTAEHREQRKLRGKLLNRDIIKRREQLRERFGTIRF